MIWKREDAGDMHEAEPERAAGEQRGGEQMADNGEVTIVGAGAKLEGTVVSAGSLRIDGQVKGQINADGDVSLSAQSQVEADIRAQNVSVAGRFKGNLVVKGKAHLARGGRIDGNITSKTLVVEEGGVFHGQSIMDGSAPTTGQSGSAATTGRTESQAAAAPPAPAGTTDKPQAAKVP
jgi:cytoskeletal protein CcmA (bactofilin family)